MRRMSAAGCTAHRRDPDLDVDRDHAVGDATTGLRSISAISGISSANAPTRRIRSSSASTSTGRPAPVAEEQLRPAQRSHELVRVLVGDRHEAQGAVGEQLRGHAAEPEQHERAERRVVRDADDHLDAGAATIGCTTAPVIAAPSRSRHRGVRLLDARLVAQVERDPADVALVHELGRRRLQHHREPELARRAPRPRRRR